ncbi:probable BOI-related E3 ubiquitin-protein ligase 3 [Durio zibethinus]|uniref:Probable BOI-related E3 ubiquitin-protein ligase 3 n=1 Tax=Durio zibethinus TaxID=66656 RepID=A0A6P6AE27_DURZI|nr:probable BOI-related E3 ubiquitin-protein ligase 3 [Durio zibethinus]
MAIQAQLYSDNIGFPLSGSQDWIENGCGGVGGFNQFCFSLQQKSQLQQLQQQQQFQQLQNQQPRNQSLYFDNSLVPSPLKNNNNSNNRESMMYCQSTVSQVENQRHEIDQFITSQNERLRLLLQEQRKQQAAVMVNKIESKASLLLRQKDEEIAKATNKTMELQNLLKKLEMENQAWQIVAQENEAMVLSLNNAIEQLRERASSCFNNGVDDAESCCEVNREGMETEENRGFAGLVADQGQEQDEERPRKMMTMVCKCCNSRSSCVLFLPCRHLCSCKDCAAFLDSCPVCRTAKKACIEALIS